jgi:hypothetical protein
MTSIPQRLWEHHHLPSFSYFASHHAAARRSFPPMMKEEDGADPYLVAGAHVIHHLLALCVVVGAFARAVTDSRWRWEGELTRS